MFSQLLPLLASSSSRESGTVFHGKNRLNLQIITENVEVALAKITPQPGWDADFAHFPSEVERLVSSWDYDYASWLVLKHMKYDLNPFLVPLMNMDRRILQLLINHSPCIGEGNPCGWSYQISAQNYLQLNGLKYFPELEPTMIEAGAKLHSEGNLKKIVLLLLPHLNSFKCSQQLAMTLVGHDVEGGENWMHFSTNLLWLVMVSNIGLLSAEDAFGRLKFTSDFPLLKYIGERYNAKDWKLFRESRIMRIMLDLALRKPDIADEDLIFAYNQQRGHDVLHQLWSLYPHWCAKYFPYDMIIENLNHSPYFSSSVILPPFLGEKRTPLGNNISIGTWANYRQNQVKYQQFYVISEFLLRFWNPLRARLLWLCFLGKTKIVRKQTTIAFLTRCAEAGQLGVLLDTLKYGDADLIEVVVPIFAGSVSDDFMAVANYSKDPKTLLPVLLRDYHGNDNEDAWMEAIARHLGHPSI